MLKKRYRTIPLLLSLSLAVWSFQTAVSGANLSLKVIAKEAPAELDGSIRTLLKPEAIQLLEDGKPVLEFWFNEELPLQSKPSSPADGLTAIKQTTLVGAALAHQARRDYKDNDLHPGVYSMRFALQPQDGNHLGSAEYPYFLALTPAKIDSKLDGIADYKALVKASSKETSSDHPVILSLRPPTGSDGELPALTEPASEHKAIRLKIPAAAPGSEKIPVIFDLVYEGKGKI